MGSGNYNTNEPEIQEQASGKGFLIGSLIGGIIGATAGFLYAPKPGKEVRNSLNENVTSVKNRANTWKETATEKTQGINSKVKDFQSKKGKSKNSEAEEAAEEVAKAIEEAAEDLEREQDPSTRTDK